MAMIITVIFGLALMEVQARPGLTELRQETLESRIEALQMSDSILEHIKSLRIDSVASEIDKLQTEWYNEIESHKREIRGVQTDYEGK